MLTPAQVKNHPFTAGPRGTYRAADVDEHLAEVAASYEQMFKENGELIRKIGLLADKVEEYRNDEDNIRAALLTAQRMADKIVREAKESVSGQLEEANSKAEQLVADATARSNAMLQEAQGRAEGMTTDATAKSGQMVSDAQRKAESVTQEAEQKAQNIVFEANRQAEEQLSAVKRSVVHESLILEMAKKEVSDFRSSLMSAYKTHIELINRLPVIAKEHLETQEQAERQVAQPEEQAPETPMQTDQAAPPTPREEATPDAEEKAVLSDSEKSSVLLKTEGPERSETADFDAPALENTQEILSLEETPEENVQEQHAGGFRVHFDELDDPVAPPSSDSSLKFGPDYDIFNDEEDDEEENTNMAFRGFFKRK